MKEMANVIAFIFSLIALIISGCGPHRENGMLTKIESMQEEDPVSALDSLYAIDCNMLSEADRHYYDFLLVKLSDKSYIRHESDSLIMEVLEYESTHQANGRYPEALYYAGRVYSDMGDYPRALSYYQRALDAMEEESELSDLRARVSSQCGLLLTNMNLHSEAIPLVATSLEISRKTNDTLNLINDMQLLAGIYMQMGDYERSQELFRDADKLAGDKYNYHAAKSMMYLALIKHSMHQTDSALFYVRDIVGNVHPLVRGNARAISANIYLEAGMKDSAYMYARELIADEDSLSKEMGYNILFDPKLDDFLPPDSLRTFINDYHRLLNARFNKNNVALAITQQSIYNYDKHQKAKEKAETENSKLRTAIMWLVLTSLVMASVILLVINRNKSRIIRLQQTLSNVKALKLELEKRVASNPGNLHDSPEASGDDMINTRKDVCIGSLNSPKRKELRESLREELMEIYENNQGHIEIAPDILGSDAYRKFKEMADNGDMVNDSSPLWNELERVVLHTSPHFKDNLLLLTSGRVTVAETHTSLLIKCGFRPVDMKIILGKSNGAVISRRDTLGIKVFGKKMETKVINGIVRLL